MMNFILATTRTDQTLKFVVLEEISRTGGDQGRVILQRNLPFRLWYGHRPLRCGLYIRAEFEVLEDYKERSMEETPLAVL